jgi:hypothetical protein
MQPGRGNESRLLPGKEVLNQSKQQKKTTITNIVFLPTTLFSKMTSFFSISFSRFTLGQIRKVVESKEILKYIYKFQSSERVPK